MHAWMSFEDIISDASTRIDDLAQHRFPPDVLSAWASQRNMEFARRSEATRGRLAQPLIPNQASYPVPPDAHQLTRVVVKYRGFTSDYELIPIEEDAILDGISVTTVGMPTHWYLKENRRELGIYQIPTVGGFSGVTDSDGNAGGTTVILSGGSTTDDFYNGQTLLILTGDYAGESRTISDYDGTTGTATVSVAFSGQILEGVGVQCDPESLIMHFIRMGNAYTIKPVNVAVQAAPAPTTTALTLNLPTRPTDYWKDCEVWVRSGTYKHFRSRISASQSVSGTPANTVVTLAPALPGILTAADNVRVTEVPNIPDAFHSKLVDGIVCTALETLGRPGADIHESRFENGIREALRTFEPKQEVQRTQIREFGKGEEYYDL